MLTFVAAFGLLAALLLLLPAPARAQETIAPTLLVARVSGNSLVLVYNEALDRGSVPAASAYSVVVDSAPGVPPSSVAVDGARITLTLSTAAASGDTVTVTYTKPSTNPLQDAAENDVAQLTNQTVANNTSATNAQPVFSSTAASYNVAENTGNGMNVGSTQSFSDTDTLTFALLGPDASSFNIDTSTGQIKTSAALDFEGRPTYNVVVSVSDSMTAVGGTDSAIDDAIAVTINVTNVNEAPVIAAGEAP